MEITTVSVRATREVPAPPGGTRSIRELEAEITELAGHLNAANYRLLWLIAEFDRRNGWSDGACPSCAHWLNYTCGLALGAAREKVRVAHALENCLASARRWRAGRSATRKCGP